MSLAVSLAETYATSHVAFHLPVRVFLALCVSAGPGQKRRENGHTRSSLQA